MAGTADLSLIAGVEVEDLDLEEEGSGWTLSLTPNQVGDATTNLTNLKSCEVEAWYLTRETEKVCCVKGTLELVLHDGREESPTAGEILTIYLGERTPRLVTIPPGIHYGYKDVGKTDAVLAVFSRDPEREPDLPPGTAEINYDWFGRHTARLI